MFENGASQSDPNPPLDEAAGRWSEEERIEDDFLEESLEETFPASDPISSNRFD